MVQTITKADGVYFLVDRPSCTGVIWIRKMREKLELKVSLVEKALNGDINPSEAASRIRDYIALRNKLAGVIDTYSYEGRFSKAISCGEPHQIYMEVISRK